MYEIKREITDYHELTKVQPLSVTENGAAGDINDTFELWVESLSPEADLLHCDTDPEVETKPRAETPPPSATPLQSGPQSELRFKGTLHVDGYFTGGLRSDHGTLVLEESGEINTDINVGVARINGTVVGNIKARDRIELGSTARVIGDLHTPALTVQPGALFEGKCYFQTEAGNGNGRRRRTASRSAVNESSGLKRFRPRHQQNGKRTQKAKPRRS